MTVTAIFRRASIRAKLVILMLLTSASGLLFVTPVWIAYSWHSTRAAAEHDLEITSSVVANNTTAAMAFGDVKAATETLSALRAKPEVLTACLYDTGGATHHLFASFTASASRCPPATGPAPSVVEAGTLTVEAPVALSGDQIGLLRVKQTLAPLYQALRTQLMVTTLVLALSFPLSLALAFRMQRIITRPILRLTDVARKISENTDYSLRVPIEGDDELSRLSADFNKMLAEIAKADKQVHNARKALAIEVEKKAAANTELATVIDNLRATQAQLVQSEKMASLGALVAGIAHEVNTPIGIGVTAASTLQAKAVQFRQKFEKNELTKSDLNQFVLIASESSDILMSNLTRAADLIQSFKRVAADQTNDVRREFELKPYIGEIVQSLGPAIKRAGHAIKVECPENLQLDSFPGTLAQILTNLVNNSLIHAFEPAQRGVIRIEARSDGDYVTLRCSDNGKGMPVEQLPSVFDPFFTTKRGTGGTGLGLNIVYNLVSKTLKGTIFAESTLGQGFAVNIRFPRVAPEPSK
jgi:signal transduction histidine kinase